MHVHAKPVELWWMLSHLVLLLALEVEDLCFIRQRAELVREVLLRGVVVPAVARVGRWVWRCAHCKCRRSTTMPRRDGEDHLLEPEQVGHDGADGLALRQVVYPNPSHHMLDIFLCKDLGFYNVEG